MPNYQVLEKSEDRLLIIRNVDESHDELIAKCQNLSFEVVQPDVKSSSRIREFLAIRLLLSDVWKLVNQHFKLNILCHGIGYESNGKPILSGIPQLSISISHSGPMVGILFSKAGHTGLDIEKISPRILKISKKFLSPAEFDWLTKLNSLSLLTLAWCSKEVVVKATGLRDIDFQNSIRIQPFTCHFSDRVVNVHYFSEKVEIQFSLLWKKIDEYIVCWTSMA
jgi:phosphopantetheinyl transferase